MINKLREMQNEEISNGFANGNLWHDLQTIIKKYEHLEVQTIETIQIYKGIEITKKGNFYFFYFNGVKYTNTNLHFAKVMISRCLRD